MPTSLLAIASIASVGLAGAGALNSYKGAKTQAAFQQQAIAQEQAAEAQRRQMLELEAHRKQLELVRNAQRARAAGLTSATNQGANFGSGLQGGNAQISGAENTQGLAIGQNLAIGRNIFDINSQISQSRIGMSQGATQSSMGAGLTSLGGAVLNSAQAFSRIGQGFGSSSRAYNPGYGEPRSYLDQ